MTEARTRRSDQKFCGACGEAISSQAVHCPQCGAPQAADAVIEAPPVQAQATPATSPPAPAQNQRTILGADEQYCSSCGAIVKKAAEICPTCGVRQHASSPSPTTSQYNPMQSEPMTARGKNKWVAFVLAFLLGGLGIHKFYLKKYAQGFIYLVLFWTFIPAIVAFIESLVYLFTPEDTFRERYPSD